MFPRKKIGEGEKIQENIVSWNQTRKHVQRREESSVLKTLTLELDEDKRSKRWGSSHDGASAQGRSS